VLLHVDDDAVHSGSEQVVEELDRDGDHQARDRGDEGFGDAAGTASAARRRRGQSFSLNFTG
jgi:hypothetical protein